MGRGRGGIGAIRELGWDGSVMWVGRVRAEGVEYEGKLYHARSWRGNYMKMNNLSITGVLFTFPILVEGSVCGSECKDVLCAYGWPFRYIYPRFA